MSISLADSALWADLFSDGEIRGLLDDAALVGAMIEVEAALAEAEGACGVIPAEAGAALAQELRGLEVSPAALSEGAARDGVPIPALLAELRKNLSPEASAYLHWGATSQDIVDTATVIQLGKVLDLLDARLSKAMKRLAEIAEEGAEIPMAARTRSQIATPTTFGAWVAVWGQALYAARGRLKALRPQLLRVSLHGAAGTDAAIGEKAGEVRAKMADTLGLKTAEIPWHADRGTMAECGAALTLLAGSIGKIGTDAILLAQSGVNEVSFAGGGSSTMPHKSNPVLAEALITLARSTARLQGGMFDAMLHGGQRDGAAWAEEWAVLRQIAVASGAALARLGDLLAVLTPKPETMLANLAAAGDGPYAEAATFQLAQTMPRTDAQAAVKAALKSDQGLASLDIGDLTNNPLRVTGAAATMARRFAAEFRED
ncbi:lyase family protein [Paracoccaceae bacterium GXU_MW_L88]